MSILAVKGEKEPMEHCLKKELTKFNEKEAPDLGKRSTIKFEMQKR